MFLLEIVAFLNLNIVRLACNNRTGFIKRSQISDSSDSILQGSHTGKKNFKTLKIGLFQKNSGKTWNISLKNM